MKTILVTGIAGFIGYHLVKELRNEYKIIGIDTINSYYDVRVKNDRLKDLGLDPSENSSSDNIQFLKTDISNFSDLENIFKQYKIDYVVNLAAQAGVRYQFENPFSYVQSNLVGFVNLLELSKSYNIEHFLYASSSSVYGLNTEQPFKETHGVDHPASLYAASKRSNELIAHSYSNLFNLPTTGLRFFTVYGPFGRPDMFFFKIAESIRTGKELEFFEINGKSLWRDYTYVSDIVTGIKKLLITKPSGGTLEKPNTSDKPFAVFNIGRGNSEENQKGVDLLEQYLGGKANVKRVAAPKTEVFKTYSDTTLLEKAIGYKPNISIEEGLKSFASWYKDYYQM